MMKYTCDFCQGLFIDKSALIQHLIFIERRRNKDRLSEVNQLIKEMQSPNSEVIHKSAPKEQPKSTPKPKPTSKPTQKPVQIDFSIPATIGNVSKEKPEVSQVSNKTISYNNLDKPVRHLDFSLPEEFPPNGIAEDPTKNKVRLIVPEDWLPYLEWKHGGRPESYRFVSSCLYRKIEGDMVLIDKIYLEGRPPEYYPIRCMNPKTLEFSFRGANQKWNKSTKTLYNLLRGNIQDTYIRYQNQGIADQMKRNSGQGGDNVLSGHDYGYWQAHISDSYTNPSYQKAFLKALVELLEERIEEYQEKHGSLCRGEPSGSDMYLPAIFINKPPSY